MEENSKKKKDSNWIGWLIFFLLVVGPNIIPPLSRFVSNLTGGAVSIGIGIIPVLIAGLVLIMVGRSIMRAINGRSEEESISFPTNQPSNTPSSSSSPFASSSSSSGWSSSGWSSTDNQQTWQNPSSSWESPSESWKPTSSSDLSNWDNLEDLFYKESIERTRHRVEKKHTEWKGLPSPPVFEPIINGKAVALIIALALVAGGGLFAAGFLNQILQVIP
jgi:hypothetical protein